MPQHRQHRNDNNQTPLDRFAESIGMGVVKLSQTDVEGLPDRIYLDRGRAFWCEIKSGTSYGKQGLSKSQEEFSWVLSKHGIELHIIESEDDLLKLKNGGN